MTAYFIVPMVEYTDPNDPMHLTCLVPEFVTKGIKASYGCQNTASVPDVVKVDTDDATIQQLTDAGYEQVQPEDVGISG
jgi:hypothetical protein